MLSTSSRSKSPISSNLPRQAASNNSFKIIGGGGRTESSGTAIQRKQAAATILNSNHRHITGAADSSSSSDTSLTRVVTADLNRGIDLKKDQGHPPRMSTVGQKYEHYAPKATSYVENTKGGLASDKYLNLTYL